MKRIYRCLFSVLCVALAACGSKAPEPAAAPESAAVTEPAANSEALQAVEGFWAYTSLKAGGSGELMPLTGVILFKDGLFAQQSIFDGEPFEKQGAMAHAGPYGSGRLGVHMVGQQTISIAPDEATPLTFHADTQHDISARRDGDELTITFASGTVQTFKRIGPAVGHIYQFDKGLLALVDDYFLLVDGDAQGVVTGYGKYRNEGTAYDLEVIRWAEATNESASAKNLRDVVLKASFDGKTFTLADGRSFRVVPGH